MRRAKRALAIARRLLGRDVRKRRLTRGSAFGAYQLRNLVRLDQKIIVMGK